LDYMQSLDQQGKDIFLNPNTYPAQMFSAEAQDLLTRHPTCQGFITDHLLRQQALARIALPSECYDILHVYLNRLHEIGAQQDPWSFTDPQLGDCDIARTAFFEAILSCCSEEQKKSLNLRLVEVPLRSGNNQLASAKFIDVAEGRGTFECVISQQIYLWGMLRKERPNIAAPPAVVNHRQARFFDLGLLTALNLDDDHDDDFHDAIFELMLGLLQPPAMGIERALGNQDNGVIMQNQHLTNLPTLLFIIRHHLENLPNNS